MQQKPAKILIACILCLVIVVIIVWIVKLFNQ